MENFEKTIMAKINSDSANSITAIAKIDDNMAGEILDQFMANEKMVQRLENLQVPLKSFSQTGGLIIACTEKLRTQNVYYNKFIQMAKVADLDKDFEIYSLGSKVLVKRK